MMPRRPRRVALVQTQAENAGAQEISRLVARGLEERGDIVRQIFFFRRTASFDDVSNARFCCTQRPSGPFGVVKLLLRLRAELKDLRPDVVVAFQHYGNVIAGPVARSIGCRAVVANQVSAGAMVNAPLRVADAAIGSLGFYDRIVINSGGTGGPTADGSSASIMASRTRRPPSAGRRRGQLWACRPMSSSWVARRDCIR